MAKVKKVVMLIESVKDIPDSKIKEVIEKAGVNVK